MLYEHRKKQAQIYIDIIGHQEPYLENLFYIRAELIEKDNTKDFNYIKDLFKNIWDEIKEHNLLLVGYYPEDPEAEEIEQYENILDYIQDLENISNELLSMFIDHAFQGSQELRDIEKNALISASEKTEIYEDLDNTYNKEIYLTALKTVFNEYYSLLTIYENRTSTYYIITLEQTFKMFNYLIKNNKILDLQNFLKNILEIDLIDL